MGKRQLATGSQLHGHINVEEDKRTVDEWNRELATELLPDTVCLAVYLVIGVLGNSSAILVYRARKRLNNEDRFFIPILTIIDLIACIVTCSFAMSINILPVKYNSDIACKILWFLGMYVTGTSAFTLMLIVIHRYLKLCTPFGRQMTHKWKKIFLAIIFCGMVFVSLPCFAFYGSASITSSSNNLIGQRCTSVTADVPKIAFVYKAILFLLIFGVLVVLVVLYSLIGRVLFKQARFSRKLKFSKEATSATSESGTLETDDEHRQPVNINKSDNQLAVEDNSQNTSTSKNIQTAPTKMQLEKHKSPGHRVTIMFMIIAVVYVVCFIPKLAMMIWESSKTDFWLTLSASELGGYRFLYTFYIINNIVNPFIYGFLDRKFRTEFKILFCRTG